MKHFADTVANQSNVLVAGALVSVSFTGTQNLAPLFSDDGLTHKSNPVTTDAQGRFDFFVADGRYDLTVSGASISTFVLRNVEIADITEAAPADVNWATEVINFANQAAPPAIPTAGTIDLYTLASNKHIFIRDDTGTVTDLTVGSGGGGGSTFPGPPINSLQKNSGSAAFVASSILDNGATVSIGEDTSFQGPNPYVDVRAFGVRAFPTNATPAIPGITATINSGSAAAALSAASTFQNGDGVVIFGAGPPHSMAQPSAPTVTPSNASSATGTGLVVNGTTGSTTYGYQIVARDKNGGLTAASQVGPTTTGLASLGPQSVGITSCTKSGIINTCTTGSTHGLTVGTMFKLFGTTDDIDFGGWNRVLTAPDGTHFSYANGFDSNNGSQTSATGGTVAWWNCNHLSWPVVAGAFEYYVYGRTGGSLTLLGVSRPQGANVDPTWDDFGSPMMDGFLAPYFVPNTPPGLPTSDNLVTTVTSGGGLTTLNLAVTAGTSVSNATILFTNGPGVVAAANAAAASGGGVFFPVTSAGNYAINSYTTLPSTSYLFGGTVFLNDSLEAPSGTRFYGDRLPSTTSALQFGFPASNSGIFTSRGNPAVFVPIGDELLFQGLSIAGFAPNNNLLVFYESGGFQSSFDTVNFSSGGAGDYMSIHVYLRGNATNAPFFNTFKNLAMIGTQGLNTSTPVFHCNICGLTQMENLSFSGRGMHFGNPMDLHIKGGRMQGGSTPLLMFGAGLGGGGTGGAVDVRNFNLDTTGTPLVVNLNTQRATFDGSSVTVDNAGYPAGNAVPNVSGIPTAGLLGYGNSGTLQNGDSVIISGGQANGGSGGTGTALTSGLGGISTSGGVHIRTFGTSVVGHGMATPSAPSVVVGNSGSCASNCVAAGTYFYAITAQDVYGNESPLSPASSAVTTDGTQTITVSWTPVAGQVQTRPFRGASADNVLSPFAPGGGVGGTSYVDSTTFGAYINTNFAFGGMSASAGSQGLTGQALILTGLGNTFAGLGVPINGTFKYCSDCVNASNPCTSGGNGAFAKRLNGAWVC